MTWPPRTLGSGFVAGRERLQERYVSVSRLPDASRLAYLRGPLHVVTEKEVAALWADAIANPSVEGETRNNIYIHVPFCKSICSFCNYERLRPSHPDLLKSWLRRIVRSMETLGPAVRDLDWGSVYIGGGTPSTLPSGMLVDLFEALNTHFNIREDAHRSFEFDPLVMSEGRVEVLAEYGFRHFSFGIQTLDPEVNKAHNRGFQNRDTIRRRFEELYKHGLHDVACDFLLGLAGTNPDSILADVEWVVETFKPKNVDVFQISPTPEYVDQHFGGSLDAFWRHLEPFQQRAVPALKALAERMRYTVNVEGGHRYTLKRSWSPPGFSKNTPHCYSYTQLVSEARQPMHLLGLGPSARSQIFGRAAYQGRSPEDALSDAPFHYSGHIMDFEDEVRTYLVHQLRDNNHVDRASFARIFGSDVTEAAAVAVSAWHAENAVELSEERLTLKTESRGERLRRLLWLVPDRHLEHEVGRRQGLDLTPDGVGRLCQAIELGQALYANHSFAGLDRDGKVLVMTPDRTQMRFRVAPGLADGEGIRLVLESAPPSDAEARKDLTRAMVQLRKVLRSAV